MKQSRNCSNQFDVFSDADDDAVALLLCDESMHASRCESELSAVVAQLSCDSVKIGLEEPVCKLDSCSPLIISIARPDGVAIV